MTWIANGLPMLLILGLRIFIMRRLQGMGRRMQPSRDVEYALRKRTEADGQGLPVSR